MAVLAVESAFRRNARPPRRKLWGWLPWRRSSSAYGYAQATDATWRDFEEARGRASRANPRESLEFVGWYFALLSDQLTTAQTAPLTARQLYTAYHQGAEGFRRGHWRSDPASQRAIARFEETRRRYADQLAGCSRQLRRGWLLRTVLRWVLWLAVGVGMLFWLRRGGGRRVGSIVRRTLRPRRKR